MGHATTRTIAIAASSMLAAASLAACSGSDGAGSAAASGSETGTATASTAPAGGQGGPSPGMSTTPVDTSKPSDRSETIVDPGGLLQLNARTDSAFVTPSGNISCYIGDGGNDVRCEVVDPTWKPRAADLYDCDFDMGTSVVIAAGTAKLGCISDTIRGLAKPGDAATAWWRSDFGTKNGMAVLSYNSSLRVNDITCESQESGVTCVDAGDGDQFELARDHYSLTHR